MYSHDIIVIGGGAGGLSVASGCAQLGVKVALIEREQLGGDCLYYGCVPSKALLHVAGRFAAARDAGRFTFGPVTVPPVDMSAVNAYVTGVIASIAQHDSPQRFRSLGAEVFAGEARFISAHEVSVSDKRLSARVIVIATGSRAAIPPIPGLAEFGYLTNRDVFSLEELPESIAVLGGGPIGVELGQAFHRLGSEVTIVEMAPRILPRDDAELAAIIHARLVSEGITVKTGVRLESVRGTQGAAELRLVAADQSNEPDVGRDDARTSGAVTATINTAAILVAAGRTANSDALNLGAAGLDAGRGGVIPVDKRLQTAVGHIYAIGDVNGRYPFTHVAGAEAAVIVRRVGLHAGGTMNYRTVPWVSYTDPELASVGFSEQSAAQAEIHHRVAYQRFSSVDRAQAEAAADGLMKIILDGRDRIIGTQIAGPGAGELLGIALHAVTGRWKFSALRAAMTPYPTMIEAYGKVVSAELGPKLFNPRVRSILRTLFRYRGTGPVSPPRSAE